MGSLLETVRTKKLLKRLPKKALSNVELMDAVKKLDLPHFRGIFMRDELSRKKPWKREMGIVNLDVSSGPGTHWVAYSKRKLPLVVYFDSFGLRPPPEVTQYFMGSPIVYNNDVKQNYDMNNCGHLCLEFLIKEAEYEEASH